MEAKTETTENHKLITSFLTPIIMRIINANTAKTISCTLSVPDLKR